MMPSRGMGAIRPSKMPKKKVIHRTDNPNDVDMYADGGEVWSKPRPSSLSASKKLSSKQKSKAKAAAKRAGRPYPNLVDNMRAAKE
jgi:hypothetical protein